MDRIIPSTERDATIDGQITENMSVCAVHRHRLNNSTLSGACALACDRFEP